MSRTRVAAIQLGFTDVRLYLFSAVFIALDVFVPWLFHQVGLGGPTFLPMHVFALLGGLLWGWWAGLLIGLTTPLISHYVSGLPPAAILSQVTIEISAYGVTAGILRRTFNQRVLVSLLGAMVAGRLALLVATFALGSGALTPPAYVWNATRTGLPGIALQLVLLPVLARAMDSLFGQGRHSHAGH